MYSHEKIVVGGGLGGPYNFDDSPESKTGLFYFGFGAGPGLGTLTQACQRDFSYSKLLNFPLSVKFACKVVKLKETEFLKSKISHCILKITDKSKPEVMKF